MDATYVAEKTRFTPRPYIELEIRQSRLIRPVVVYFEFQPLCVTNHEIQADPQPFGPICIYFCLQYVTD